MKKCKVCGGVCMDVGNGRYQCDCCGSMFSEDDFVSRSSMKKEMADANVDVGVNLFDKVINGVLEIRASGKNSSWSGSGYIISLNGYAMTNAHVAADNDGSPCSHMTVNVCGKTVPARVVALADDKAGHGSGVDLAIIQLTSMPQGVVALQLEDFNNVRTGERVFVLGNSLGDGTCITSGIVSDRSRVFNGKTLLMTDCAINGGNSGGPIFNADGKVIGTICSSRLNRDGTDTKGMNYAVPVSIVSDFINKTKIRL